MSSEYIAKITIVRSGQPRAYADTERLIQIELQHKPFKTGVDGKLKPTGDYAKEFEPWVGIKIGEKVSELKTWDQTVLWKIAQIWAPWSEHDPLGTATDNHFRTQLKYCTETKPGVYEVLVITPFTD